MYDRTHLRRAAKRLGDTNANRIAVRLGIGRMTAHRLWNGTAAPSAGVAAAVEETYGVPTSSLVKRMAA